MRFNVRPVRKEDKAPLANIVRSLWEGTDYLPGLFDDWVRDNAGEFCAVEWDGRLVGCGKLTWLTEKDAWLEGLRSDTTFKHRGIGKAFLEYMLPRVARKNPETVRFATYWGNIGSVKNAERFGFLKEKELNVKSREIASGPIEAPDGRYRPADRAEKRLFLNRTSFFSQCGGYILDGWRAHPVKKEILEVLTDESRFFRILDEESPAWLAFAMENRPAEVKLTLFECSSPESGRRLLRSFLYEMQKEGIRYVETVLPDDLILRHVFAAEGFFSWEREHDYWIYGLPLSLLSERYGG